MSTCHLTGTSHGMPFPPGPPAQRLGWLDRRRSGQGWALMELLPQPMLLVDAQRRLLASNSHSKRLLSQGQLQAPEGRLAVLGQLDALQLSQLLAQAIEGQGANVGIWFERDMTTGWLHVTPTARHVGEDVTLLLALYVDRPALTQAARIDALCRCCKLSCSERYVLMLLSDGLVVDAVAQQLSLQISTVRTHVRNLLGKTQAPSLMQLLRWTGSAAAHPH